MKKHQDYKGMKKHHWVYFIIFFWILCQFFSIVNVQSAEADIVICNWDDVASGLDSGTSGYFTWENTGTANFFETSTVNSLSSPNSFRMGSNDPSIGEGYWNLTTDFNYIYQINFSFYYVDNTNYHMLFYDSDDNLQLKMYFVDSASDFRLSWYNVSGGSDYMLDQKPYGRYYVIITHVTTNYFNIKTYNSSWNLQSNLNLSGMYASNWTNFSYIFFDWIGGATTPNKFLYFDNFYINTQSPPSAEYLDFSSYNYICSGGLGLYCNPSWTVNTYNIFGWLIDTDFYYPQYIEHQFPFLWSGTIHGVDIPISNDQYNQVSSSLTNYYLYINGVPLGNPDAIIPSGDRGNYLLRFYDATGITLSDEKPLFAIKSNTYYHTSSANYYWYGIGCSYSPIGESRGHSNSDYFMDDIFNGNGLNSDMSICFYFEGEGTISDDPFTDEEWANYTTNYGNPNYGNMFLEFYNQGYDCYYRVGSEAKIIFNLSDDYLEDDSPYYQYWIYKAGTSLLYFTGLITVNDDYYRGVINTNYKFTSTGWYYIITFNTTAYGTETNQTLLTSRTMYVCEASADTGGEGESVDTGIGVIIPNLRGTMYGGLVGVIIVGICMIIPMRIQKGLRMKQKLPSFVYVFMASLGICIATILPFFDVWVLAFLVIISFIYIGARYLLKSGSVEAEE